MYLSEDLITAVKRRCNVPTSQVTFTNSDFLALADEEIRSKMVPLILRHMEEFYISIADFTILQNQSAYEIPYRAIAMALRDVFLVSDTNPDVRVGLERLNPEDLYGGISGSPTLIFQKSGFYLQGNSVILYPKPTTTSPDTLRMTYAMRPSSLVETSATGIITAINTSTFEVTVSALPSNITIATPVDFVKAIPGFECTAIDQTISSIASNVLTMSAAPPDTLAVGDYVCQAGYSNVVQVPVELQPLLYQYVVIRILAAQGDQTDLKAAFSELQSLETAAGMLLAPRVTGKVKRCVKSRSISRWV